MRDDLWAQLDALGEDDFYYSPATTKAKINEAIGTLKAQAARIAELEVKLEVKVNAVYSERNRLASAFARMALVAGFKAGKGVDPDETKWPVVYVDTPNGQVSWHIAEQDADVLSALPEYGGEWDGQFRSRDPLWPVWEITSPITAKDARIAELEAALIEIKFMTTEADGAARAEALIDEVLEGGKDGHK